MNIAIVFRALNNLFEKIYPLANSHIKSMLLRLDYIELEMDIDISVDYIRRLTFNTLHQYNIFYNNIKENNDVSIYDMTIGYKKIHVRIAHCRSDKNNHSLDYSIVTMSTELTVDELEEFCTMYNE